MEYCVRASSVDRKSPLIYMWEIHDGRGAVVGRYIGKANGGDKRPTQHYPRNVKKLLKGLRYRNDKDYRRVHYALAEAVVAGHTISLTYLCNVADDVDIFEVESRYINEYRCNADDGIGLNGRSSAPPLRVTTAALPVAAEAPGATEAERPDLDDFLEYFTDRPRGVFEVRVNTRSCSVWSAGRRILRAKQATPGGRVMVKLVQSSTPDNHVEFAWDGANPRIDAALATERQRLVSLGHAPSF